ncbi:hypothetical protein ACFWMJ_16705 [Streptomyces hawaiiensis]|uniref:hypothetical protein n=1 Tax=Streptomyces hawaiiensis TaxID=67305 RepID=UPI00365F5D5F
MSRSYYGMPPFIKTHSARVYAVVVAVPALVAHFVPSLSSPLIGVPAARRATASTPPQKR